MKWKQAFLTVKIYLEIHRFAWGSTRFFCCCQCGKIFYARKVNDESLTAGLYSESWKRIYMQRLLKWQDYAVFLYLKTVNPYLEVVSVLKTKRCKKHRNRFIFSMVEIKELCYSVIQVACNTTFFVFAVRNWDFIKTGNINENLE